MSDNFKYQCNRRFARQHPVIQEAVVKGEELLGSGSGGDPGDGGNFHYHEGWYAVGAAQVSVCAEGGMGKNACHPMLSLLAGSGEGVPDGQVVVRGSQGVRITAGPAPGLPANHDGMDGIELATGETQSITLSRGLIVGQDQTFQMSPGSIVADGGSGSVSLLSLTSIALKVAGGVSSITLTPTGIVLKGPIIQIN